MRGAISVAICGALVMVAATARAQPAEKRPSAAAGSGAADDKKLGEAKRLFREGNELRKAGDFEKALGYYLRSRALLASVPNTINAAYCLAKLERHDEALELYEELITKFSDELTDGQRQETVRETRRLRGKVGSINVQANAEGAVFIDGRRRGELPLIAPIRVMPGEHVVRVLRDGYRGFETTVTVKVGEVESVVAELQSLTSSGVLRIEGDDIEGAEVFVDGAPMGESPWEGMLAPGEHYFFVRKGDDGSAPKSVVIVAGQKVVVTPQVSPLGPELHIVVEPPTAKLRIGGVAVGAGGWHGRLPVGTHEIAAREEGYHESVRRESVDELQGGDLKLELETDPDHPRWQAAGDAGAFWVEVFGGPALAPSLGSEAEEACADDACEDNGLALGLLVGGRAGYELPIRLSVEIAGGYLMVSKSLTRAIDDSFTVSGTTVATHYTLTDELSLRGPFAAAGIGYRLPIGELVELRLHGLVGAHFASTSDTVTGTVTDGTNTGGVKVAGSGESASAPNLVVIPELSLGVRFGGFGASLGLTAVVMALDGPELETGDVTVTGSSCPPASPPTVGCAPGEAIIAAERAYGTHVLLVPTLTVGYLF